MRLGLAMCIFVAFPASGQVDGSAESGSAGQARAADTATSEALARVPDQTMRAGQAVRLVATEPRLGDVPVVALPVDNGSPQKVARKAAEPDIVPDPGRRDRREAAPAAAPAALLAVPAAPPPQRSAGARRMSGLEAMLPGAWSHGLLVAAMASACLGLFWWLGLRSRGVEPAGELALTAAMAARDEDPALPLPAEGPSEAEEAAWIAETRGAALPVPADNAPAVPVEPFRRPAEEDVLLLDASARPRFESFHAAMAAMNAELARISSGGRDRIAV